MRDASKNIFATAIIIVFVIVLAAGMWIYRGTNGLSALEAPFDAVVSPKWVNQAQFAGIFVAKDLGLYEQEEISVMIDEFRSGDSVLQDLKNGTSQFGLMNAQEFLVHYSRGEPIIAVAALYQVSPYILASLKGNSITSPAELKGKRLGLKGSAGADAQIVYDLLLASAGLTHDDVTFVTIPFGTSEKEDLVADRADIIGFYRTRLYQFDRDGVLYDVIYPEQYGAALYNDVIVTTTEFLEQHPDVVEGFVHATVAGWEYAFDHEEDAVAITLRYVTDATYKDIDYERYLLAQSEPLMRPDDTMVFGAMDLDHWQRFYDALAVRGLFEKPFDVSKTFTTEFLPQ